LFHILVSLWVVSSTTAWEKSLVMCHMSASQVLNAPTYTRPLWLQMTLYKTLTFATSASPESS